MLVGYCPAEMEVMAPLHQDMMRQCCRKDGHSIQADRPGH